ncbi:O-methylsterigmatocystin oxidoreductase [Grifola frondosa]|uniref:O-methylsterigmatocystin oxidoreductase n=1 Tax=Grifola frondosa TaxID=5627 RepID=A0A1C7MN37_GRIFR|nr:O-methylsterigmatocystin oxidoreductase [Grifola frondosa]
MLSDPAAVVGYACLLVVCVTAVWRYARKASLPPGPPRSLWRGNENQLPWVEPWKVYAEWSKNFGSLIYLYAYGRDVLIVNGAREAEAMLDDRGLIYARRPTWSMVALTGRQDNIAFMDYNERQRKSRAIMQAALNPRSQRQWGPVLEEETLKLIQHLLGSPDEYRLHMKRYLATFINRYTYGTEINDAHMKLADELSAHTQQALRPGRWIVDSISFLFKRWAREAKTKFRKFTSVPYFETRVSVVNGTANESMVAETLKDILSGNSRFDEDALISAASSIYTAATDTTTAVLLSFLLLITVHQDVQAQAYAEIARVVGTSRLPGLADQAALPYVNAVMKEVHRFNPVTPMIPRSPIQDDLYEGQRIPRDTWAMFNIWAMTHDPAIYADPHIFRPERHLDKAPPKDPRDFAFGFGKRLCPGMNLANAQIFLFMSQLLAVFHIRPPLGADGHDAPPPLDYTSTFVRSVLSPLSSHPVLRGEPPLLTLRVQLPETVRVPTRPARERHRAAARVRCDLLTWSQDVAGDDQKRREGREPNADTRCMYISATIIQHARASVRLRFRFRSPTEKRREEA